MQDEDQRSGVTHCYHCGDTCGTSIKANEKFFCCDGCRQVFLLLEQEGLCTYYAFDQFPGIKKKHSPESSRFNCLDRPDLSQRLITFRDGNLAHVTFFIPDMHCVSCIWLLENLHRIDSGIIRTQVNFQQKEIHVVFDTTILSLGGLAERLHFIGYEPHIPFEDEGKKADPGLSKHYLYRLGLTAFCFGNIMMLSFPEYFSGGNLGSANLESLFRYLNLALALPVLCYGASEFFVSAWKGLRQLYLNIELPIALALIVTFGRSVYEILTGTGPGYLDSMSGIVFFMLIGRWFQSHSYAALRFNNSYKSFFPLSATVLREGREINTPLQGIKEGDLLWIRNEELIPADAILRSGEGQIDYSFVSGESQPAVRKVGELIYAGGRQKGSAIEVEVIKPVLQSQLLQLWNNDALYKDRNSPASFIHPWSRYFTAVLLLIVLLAVCTWAFLDPTRIWLVATSLLIVACPCSLLLSATFTYGQMVRILGRNGLFLKHAGVLESLSRVTRIVFDKTGTLTRNSGAKMEYRGDTLEETELSLLRAVTRQSAHPLSRMIYSSLPGTRAEVTFSDYREYRGRGLEASIPDGQIRLGSIDFVLDTDKPGDNSGALVSGSRVGLSINGRFRGQFDIEQDYRPGLREMAGALKHEGFQLDILSGDVAGERQRLEEMFGPGVVCRFQANPSEKINYIQALQEKGDSVMMLGDGLNDAGALRQSDIGVAVSDESNLFTPACDAILEGDQVPRLAKTLRFARSGKNLIRAAFGLSILYNIIGITLAAQGRLSPLVAAILMPASSISIVLFAISAAYVLAKRSGLNT